MKTIKEIDKELYTVLKNRPYLIGFNLGCIEGSLKSPKREELEKRVREVITMKELSPIEAITYLHRNQLIELGNSGPKDQPVVDFTTLDDVYAGLIKDNTDMNTEKVVAALAWLNSIRPLVH